MDKLKFPKINKDVPCNKNLNMDEYLAFVDFNLTYLVDTEAIRKDKNRNSVRIRFKF